MTIDDWLKGSPQLAVWRPRVGIKPALSDAELVTLAVMSVFPGFTSERRWLRYAREHLAGLFPYLPGQSSYDKRLRAATTLVLHMIQVLGRDTSLWQDDVWVVDSTPVECGRSPRTARRSALAGWATTATARRIRGSSGGCSCTCCARWAGCRWRSRSPAPRPTSAPLCWGCWTPTPGLAARHPEQTIIADKHYYGRVFEQALTDGDLRLLRQARKGEPARTGTGLFKPLRQTIESINQTFKGQLDLERHGGRTEAGVIIRVTIRILALTAAIWHNDKTGQPTTRSLIAYDH